MRHCPYFDIWSKRIARRTRALGEEAHYEIKVPYCRHPQSPAPLEAAQHGLGDHAVLTCGGNLRECPLPDGIRPQPEPRPHMASGSET